MTGDPPRRWDDDSTEEDFEVRRATDEDGIARWTREQKLRPLADTLAEHGVLPGGAAESWCSTPAAPGWFGQVPEPQDQCWMCQRPGIASPCGECREAREHGGHPSAAYAWWAGLAPARRRFWLAARHGTDPWTGRPVRLEAEWTDITADGAIATARHRFHAIIPATAWDLGDRAGLR